MTENPTTIPACLDDDEGGTLHVYPWASGRVSLVALDGDQGTEFGPVERHVLLDAIREVAGETDDKPEPAPAPTTPREALALAVDLAYEPEGDTMPDQPGYMRVEESGVIHAYPDSNPHGLPARGVAYRRLLLDPPAPATPAWHNARIVEATRRGRVCQWARTATDGLWVSLDGESREAYTPDLTDVTVVVPGEVEA